MWKAATLILIMILIGTIGFHAIEGLSFLDSLYMTIITISTVGFREVKEPLTPLGKVFTIFIIVGGVGTVIFTFTKIAEAVYEGTINKIWRRKRMNKKIRDLKDHYIICGHGRMGRIVRERLEEEKLPFVVIDNNETKLEDIKDSPFIEGDATHEDVLLQAGIKKAKALAALLPSDADNLYLVLTVKLINPSLFVLSKGLDEEGEQKILQIGANRVVSPYKVSGLKIAQGLIRPTLVDFMDLIIRRSELTLAIEEFAVRKNSRITGKNIAECDIRRKANVIVIAIKKPGQDLVFNPSPEIKIDPGDILLVLGNRDDIDRFEITHLKASA